MYAGFLATGVATLGSGAEWSASAAATILGWTAVHSLWQAALVGCALALVLRFVPGTMTCLRTVLVSGSLLLIAGLTVVVWLGLAADWRQHDVCWRSDAYADGHPALCASHGVMPPADAVADEIRKQRAVLPWAGSLASAVDAPAIRRAAAALTSAPVLPLIGLLWCVVAASALAGLLRDVTLLRRFVRRSRPPEDSRVVRRLERVRNRMGVRSAVDVRESDDVGSPGVAGWRSPVILFPCGMTQLLGPRELDAILRHELVHVRGRHFILNLAQRALECVFAWNPFVLRISRSLREEREALCDAAAAGPPDAVTARRHYAETLLRVERLRTPTRVESVALLGQGTLLRRVRRLTETATPSPFVRASRTASAGLATVAAILVTAQMSVATTEVSSRAVMERDIAARQDVGRTSDDRPAAQSGTRDSRMNRMDELVRGAG